MVVMVVVLVTVAVKEVRKTTHHYSAVKLNYIL